MVKGFLLACCLLLVAFVPAARSQSGPGSAASGTVLPGGDLLPSQNEEACGNGGEAPCPEPEEHRDDRTAGTKQANRGLIAVGSAARPFTAQSLDGTPFHFEPGKVGRSSLLIFWSLFCGPCRDELPMYDRVVKEYRTLGLDAVAINLDGSKLSRAVANFLRMNRFSLDVVFDAKKGERYVTVDEYGVAGTPTLVLIGPGGMVRWTHVGRVDPAVLEAEIRKSDAR